MNSTIWKFDLPWEDVASVEMPKGAVVLSVGVQPDGIGGQALKLWAIVPDPHAEKETRRFRVAGTGHPLHEPHSDPAFSVGGFLGTVIWPGGSLVFHVFSEYDPSPVSLPG